jgi:hypothetical protein
MYGVVLVLVNSEKFIIKLNANRLSGVCVFQISPSVSILFLLLFFLVSIIKKNFMLYYNKFMIFSCAFGLCILDRGARS